MACPRTGICVFHNIVEPSIIKRVRYASLYSYCRGGHHEECALFVSMERSLPIALNLMPDGKIGDYCEDERSAEARRFLIIEDSPVFAALASSAIASNFTRAHVVRKLTFDEARAELAQEWAAIVCGFGVGGDKTAHDVRRHTPAPMVVLTGRPDVIDLPDGARRVNKGDGPEALVAAIRACLA